MDIRQDQKLDEMIARIAVDVTKAHQSEACPNFSFLSDRLKSGMHDSCIEMLFDYLGEGVETTDLNDDLARVVFFRSSGRVGKSYTIWLSLLGNYVAVFEKGRKGVGRNDIPKEFANILKNCDLMIIPDEVYARSIMVLGETTVWRALFSDELPPPCN